MSIAWLPIALLFPKLHSTWKPQLTAPQPLRVRMCAMFRAFDDVHRLGDAATHPIARFSSRLTALLLIAGPGPLRRLALPADSKTAHPGAFN